MVKPLATPPPRPMPFQRQEHPFSPLSQGDREAWEKHQDNLEKAHQIQLDSWDKTHGHPAKNFSSLAAVGRLITSRM